MRAGLAKVYFFDLDRTLVKVNITQKFFLHYVCKNPLRASIKILSNLSLFFCYIFHPSKIANAHQLIIKLIEDDYENVIQLSQSFSKKLVRKAIFMPVYQELMRAMHLGQKVFILSAAPEFIVKLVADAIGDLNGFGTIYSKDVNDQLKIVSILSGEQKAKIVERIQSQYQLSKDELIAYSDSIHDLEFLCSVGQPVVVNADRQLKKIAYEENWRMIQ